MLEVCKPRLGVKTQREEPLGVLISKKEEPLKVKPPLTPDIWVGEGPAPSWDPSLCKILGTELP